MLPGKKYKPEDILRILRHRIWLVLVPLAVVSAATALVARQLPNRYRSDTLIQLTPQRVPDQIVKSPVATRIDERLPVISAQILNRTRLERIIQEFNLYPDERRTGIMEDIVERMRSRDVRVEVVKGEAFRVSFIGDDPRTVLKVTEQLASLFIEQNSRDRESLAEGTQQFLEAQLEDARQRLAEHEKKLEEYRRRHPGELPSQLTSNLQMIQNTQVQIQSVLESLNRDRDRRLILERQIADAQAEAAVAPPPQLPQSANGGDSANTAGTTAQQIEQARAALQALELKFKPGHPDIRHWQRRLRELEKKAEAEALQAPVSAGATPPPPATPVEALRLRRLADLKAEYDQLGRQIAYKQGEEQRLRASASGIQARVDVAPTRESEMSELTRDYTTLQALYASLLGKREDSKMSTNLERRQIGEQFKLLEPARMPQKPFTPNRQQIGLMGLAAGLTIGLALVGLLEYRDSTFKTDDEVAELLALPVLAVVPSMLSEGERRTRSRRRFLMHVGLGSMVTTCLALVAYTLLR